MGPYPWMAILTNGGYHERHAMCSFIVKQADVALPATNRGTLRQGDEYGPTCPVFSPFRPARGGAVSPDVRFPAPAGRVGDGIGRFPPSGDQGALEQRRRSGRGGGSDFRAKGRGRGPRAPSPFR